jgi:hypothetical protein
MAIMYGQSSAHQCYRESDFVLFASSTKLAALAASSRRMALRAASNTYTEIETWLECWIILFSLQMVSLSAMGNRTESLLAFLADK